MQVSSEKRCRNSACHRSSFIQDYRYWGYLSEVEQQIGDMAVNGSGIRDTTRVLKISPTTVIEELKKRNLQGTDRYTTAWNTRNNTISYRTRTRVEDAEIDPRQSFVESKKQERWLWHAIDYETGKLLAYALVPHQDAAFKQLQSLRSLRLAFSISIPTVEAPPLRHLDPQQHTIGKANTPTIECKHLTMRTRIKRLTRTHDLRLKVYWLAWY